MRELTGATKALLGEYRKAIDELIVVIQSVDEKSLSKVVDEKTSDPDSKSIQTVLSHVINSGYGYTVYIENSLGMNKTRPEKKLLNNVVEYSNQLNIMFEYCEIFFRSNSDIKLEEHDNSKKIKVNWGQQYDVEQLMEHAIVHILRHRRQIESFIKLL
ncbi:MAG: DinB family protein [Bacteroidia bacterium]|nr:DinB family protein [Bacteroidia bacterium]